VTKCELLDIIAACGGIVVLEGGRIRYDLSGDAAPLLPELIARREEILRILQEREAIPPLPVGLRLVTWRLKPVPVIVETVSVVGDSASFAREKIKQLSIAKTNQTWKSIVPQLLDQLAQVGVILTDKQDHQDSQE
jgi:hypothetical protein